MTHVSQDYVARSVAQPAELGDVTAALELPPAFAETYGDVLLPRPLFAYDDEISAFADDLVALVDLLSSIPERCFGGDLERYCAAVGMRPRHAELVLRGTVGTFEMYGRADAYHDGTRFRALEVNVGSNLGGVDFAQLNRAMLGVDAFGRFAADHGLRHVDTTTTLAALLRRAGAPVTRSGDPVVGLVEAKGGLAGYGQVYTSIREALRDHGIDLLIGETDQLSTVKGKVALDGTPLDVVLRYFTVNQLVDDDPRADEVLDLMVDAHRAGDTVLFSALDTVLFDSKGALGLLHHPRVRARLDPAERELVDRVLPWTRVLGPAGDTTPVDGPEDDPADLLEHCRARRRSLILKHGVGYGGIGAVLGREVDDDEWSAALAAADGGDYVVQEVVTPVPEPVRNPDTGEVEDWWANWGIFFARDGYAGAFVRALKPSDGSVISFANKGTRAACVFTSPAKERRAW